MTSAHMLRFVSMPTSSFHLLFFSRIKQHKSKLQTTNLWLCWRRGWDCRWLFGGIYTTVAVKDGHLKRDRPPDSIVAALAEAMNQAEFHQQRESGMGKGTIKKKNTEHTTTNFSNQCTFSWRRGEINSRLKGYCREEVRWRVRAVDKYSLSSGQ